MKTGFMLAFLLMAVAMLPARADEKSEKAVNASDRESLSTVSTWVRKEMDPGGRYSYVTSDEREKVSAELDAMGNLMEQRGDVEHMNADEKTKMFNSQEHVNSILAKRDNDRLVCKNENPIGSHIPVKTCQTAGVLEARRRNDTLYLQRTQSSPQLQSGR